MLTCLSFSECKTDLRSVGYTAIKNILTHIEIDIPTWCYSSTYTKDTITNYVS